MTLQEQYGKKLFIAERSDGFAARIGSLVNAMILAEIAGGEYLFCWDSRRGENDIYHSTESYDTIFDLEFVQNHMLDRGILKNATLFFN